MMGQGWYNESKRHSLARQGIRTGSAITNMQDIANMPMSEEDFKRQMEDKIGYPVYDEQEQYPAEYDQLNHDNPLFAGMKEQQQTLLSVPTLQKNDNKTIAKDFDKKLFDY